MLPHYTARGASWGETKRKGNAGGGGGGRTEDLTCHQLLLPLTKSAELAEAWGTQKDLTHVCIS